MENAVAKYVMSESEIMDRLGITLEGIEVLDKKYRGIIVAGVDDKENYQAAKSARMDLVHFRTKITKSGKALREEAKNFQSFVIDVEKKIIAKVSPIEDYLTSQEKIVDDEKERIRAEKDAKEAARIQDRINLVCSFGAGFTGKEYCAYGLVIDAEALKFGTDEMFNKYISQLREAKEAADKKVAEEAEAQRIEKERLEKIREEQEAEAKRLSDIKAAQDKQAAEIKAAQDAIDAEKKRIADEETARLKAIADAQALENAKKEAAEKARIDTEARIKREAAEKEKAEAKIKADAEKKAARAPDKEKLLLFAKKFEEPENPKMATSEGKEILDIFNQKIEDALTDLRERVRVL